MCFDNDQQNDKKNSIVYSIVMTKCTLLWCILITSLEPTLLHNLCIVYVYPTQWSRMLLGGICLVKDIDRRDVFQIFVGEIKLNSTLNQHTCKPIEFFIVDAVNYVTPKTHNIPLGLSYFSDDHEPTTLAAKRVITIKLACTKPSR